MRTSSGTQRAARLGAMLCAALGTALGTASDAHAESARVEGARVEGVKLPAWVEHGGARAPLAAGAAVEAGDSVITGDDARVLLRMPEGSAVRLGANAALRVADLQQTGTGPSALVRASLDVLSGAFRFTTGFAEKFARHRDVAVHFSVITAGIRGTDLWGKTSAEREVVCLLDGTIAVDRPGDATVTLTEPKTFYVNDHAAAAPTVAPLPEAQLARWTLETDIAVDSGAQVEGGRWQVAAYSGADAIAALNAYQALRGAGYPVQMHPEGGAAHRRYDVLLTGLASRADADSVAARLKDLGGLTPVVRP